MSDGILFLIDLVFLAGILTGCLLAASYEIRREREQQAYFDHLLAQALANQTILGHELADPDLEAWERELANE